ncbi:hypothetical protein BU15DRAFT_77120 [Melanogaster broomeanus]|nr:hypothetical protein BU15DRAFT_77120 [Melanogaster broomeanus]
MWIWYHDHQDLISVGGFNCGQDLPRFGVAFRAPAIRIGRHLRQAQNGVVKQLLIQEGEVAKVGAGICLIEAEEEEEDHISLSKTKTSIESPAPSQSEGPPVDNIVSITEVPREHTSAPRKKHPLDPTNDAISTSPRTDNSLAIYTLRNGRDGRVVKTDVEAFIARGSVRDEPMSLSVQAEEKDAVVELGRTRYGMWKAMTQSLEIPHFGCVLRVCTR